MADVITGTVKQSHLSTTSYSLLLFMSVICSSKVILWMTSEGSPIASGSTYRSSDKIRRDNQGRAHVKITHRCSSAMDHDQEPRYQRVPSSTTLCAHPQEALGFIAAPQIVNRGTITEHTTQKKFHVAQFWLHRSKHHEKEGQQTMVVTRLGVNKEVIRRSKYSAREHSLIAKDN